MYILLISMFIIPLFYLAFFCSLCCMRKNLNEDGIWGLLCCVNVSTSDEASLKILFIMLIVSIISPFTLTFLVLLATNLDGIDDVSFIVILIPIEVLILFMIVLYGVVKKIEHSRL